MTETVTDFNDTQETLDEHTFQPSAVIALRYGDCSLFSPIPYSEKLQKDILQSAASEATAFEIPLIVPEGLEELIGEEIEIELLPVKSKTNESNTLKENKKYFKKVKKSLQDIGDISLQSVIVVGNRVSPGAIKRHCDDNDLSLLGIIDCFEVKN